MIKFYTIILFSMVIQLNLIKSQSQEKLTIPIIGIGLHVEQFKLNELRDFTNIEVNKTAGLHINHGMTFFENKIKMQDPKSYCYNGNVNRNILLGTGALSLLGSSIMAAIAFSPGSGGNQTGINPNTALGIAALLGGTGVTLVLLSTKF